jgi:DNA-binding transcriptional MocR family regulator
MDVSPQWGVRLLQNGAAAEIVHAVHQDARRGQALIGECQSFYEIVADRCFYRIVLPLSEGWRSDSFAAAAARAGVAISPSGEFAMTPGQAPNAVHLQRWLSAPPNYDGCAHRGGLGRALARL